MKSLITGIAGFAGSHLADLLIDKGDEVGGILRPEDSTDRIEHILPKLSLYKVDVTVRKAVQDAVEAFRPERIFHLAGIAHVGGSWSNREATFEVNIMGGVNVIEAAGAAESSVLLAGSGEEYGPLPEDRQPVSEDCPLRPRNPYGASKVAQEVIGIQYHLGQDFKIFLARPFNHCGARQEPAYVVSDFARQVAEIEFQLRPPEIKVGNLEALRDFSDVRDMVQGYLLLVEKGRPGVPYNLCSGVATRIGDFLETLLSLSGTRIEIVVEKERYRPLDNPLMVGDPGLAAKDFDWSARIPLNETLEWTLEYWRQHLKKA
ncbi:GDP-mannose 4,6-dehydratase [Acidobacteriota bacterium]